MIYLKTLSRTNPLSLHVRRNCRFQHVGPSFDTSFATRAALAVLSASTPPSAAATPDPVAWCQSHHQHNRQQLRHFSFQTLPHVKRFDDGRRLDRVCSSNLRWMTSKQQKHQRLQQQQTDNDDDDDDEEFLDIKKGLEEILEQDFDRQELEMIDTTRQWVERVVVGWNLCPFAERPLKLKQLSIKVIRGNDINLEGIEDDGQDESNSEYAATKKNHNDDDSRTKTITATTAVNDDTADNDDDNDNSGSIVLTEIVDLILERVKIPGTTLVVCPELYPNDFVSFLNVVEILQEGVLPDCDLEGKIQIAPFHPLFEFAENDEEEYDSDEEEEDDDEDDDHESKGLNKEIQTSKSSTSSSIGSKETTTTTTTTPVGSWTNRSPYPILHILREVEVTRAVERLEGDSSKVWKRNIKLLNAIYNDLGRNDETFESAIKGTYLKPETDSSDGCSKSSKKEFKQERDRIEQIIRNALKIHRFQL